ncbi:MAG: hypothetical protein HUJ98_05760 [Bacteroidaceae bacterium]|nr:hypothetical protein [Bacteroidaceae bacterium]
MEFTYDAYKGLVELIRTEGYEFKSYHDFDEKPCVIMRHDIDLDVKKAYEFSLVEDKLGIKSTYFALLNTDFYNLASNTCKDLLKDMIARGHEIGLHFDEARYAELDSFDAIVAKEAGTLSEIIDAPVKTVSMHRPSQKALTGDWRFEGIVNTYGKTFFNDFKYLSDSRMNWREDPVNAIKSGEFNHIQIVTHPFWYGKSQGEFKDLLLKFAKAAGSERYDALCDNIKDFENVIKKEEIC